MTSDNGRRWGLSHLPNHPITLTFGVTVLLALLVLAILRVAHAEVDVEWSAGIGQTGSR